MDIRLLNKIQRTERQNQYSSVFHRYIQEISGEYKIHNQTTVELPVMTSSVTETCNDAMKYSLNGIYY